MYITDVSIRRPVVAWVMSLILVVFGIFVFSKLPVRELPDGLQPPVVQIKVDYKSASAPIIDQEVTQIIEDVVGGTEGIKNIDSKSENGGSTINVEFENDFEMDEVRNLLSETAGVVLIDNIQENKYPMPLYAKNNDDVMVGRLRRDESQSNALNMWVVADNLRKGAATNAVEILEGLIKN